MYIMFISCNPHLMEMAIEYKNRPVLEKDREKDKERERDGIWQQKAIEAECWKGSCGISHHIFIYNFSLFTKSSRACGVLFSSRHYFATKGTLQ